MAVALTILALVVILLPIVLIRFRKRWVAAFNLVATNRITGRFAARLPGFGMLTHRGRKSGRLYRTPINVFPVADGFLIALTYGQDAHWVKNVLAAGGCQLETRGQTYQVSTPAIVHDPSRRSFPFPVRIILRIIGASDFIRLTTVKHSQGILRQAGGAGETRT